MVIKETADWCSLLENAAYRDKSKGICAIGVERFGV
jgi:hypothetical protein